MKTYTFTLPKNNNSAKIYKEKLMDRIITAYPWMTVESKCDYPYSNDGIEYASAGDMITLGVSKTHNVSWLPKEIYTNKTAEELAKELFGFDPYNNINFDLETEFYKAINALNVYANEHYPFEKDYDYVDEFGTPIKIFDNFIQIGYEIIPIAAGSLNHLKPKTKKTIIDITIKIKNRGLY
jgi:hypothetical protein